MELCFFFQAEDGIRDDLVTGVQTCALPISTCRGQTKTPGSPALRRQVAAYESADKSAHSKDLTLHRRDMASQQTALDSHDLSREYFDRAQRITPGGVHSPLRAFNTVGGTPVFFRSAQGATMTSGD